MIQKSIADWHVNINKLITAVSAPLHAHRQTLPFIHSDCLINKQDCNIP